jgi:hypothetical protein
VLKDATGKYNPENAASPLAGTLEPMRPVRVRATHNSTTYGLFFGFIRRIEHHPHRSRQESVIECVDFFEWLRVSRPVLALGVSTAKFYIESALDTTGLIDPAFRAIDLGHTVGGTTTDGTRSLLDLARDLLAVDMGVAFVNGSGVITYHDTNRRFAAGAVADTFTDAFITDAAPATDAERIRNGFTVTRTPGGVPQTVSDAATRGYDYFGPRDGPPLSSDLLLDDSHAQNLAAFKVLLGKSALDPTTGLRLTNDDDTNIVKQLARDLGDRVAVTETKGGTSFTGFIEGVTHRIWEAGRFHTTEYAVTRRRFDMATVGTSTVGSAHVVGY